MPFCGYLITGCGCPAADADDIIQDTILAIRKRYWPKVRTLDKPQAYWFKAAERRYRRLAGRQARRIDGADPETRLLGVAHPLDQFAAVDRREDPGYLAPPAATAAAGAVAT